MEACYILLDHMCWTTTREVRRVGLRAERFVEAGPRAGRFVEACYILGAWSSICLTYRLENLGAVRFLAKNKLE